MSMVTRKKAINFKEQNYGYWSLSVQGQLIRILCMMLKYWNEMQLEELPRSTSDRPFFINVALNFQANARVL